MALWSGQVVSAVGSQVSLLAFPLLMLAITHSAAQTGLLIALANLPDTLLTLPLGVLVDRWDRKRLMVVSEATRGLALGSIPLALALGQLSLAQLAVVSLVEGAFANLYSIAESACLPQVVSREDLPAAVALGATSDAAARLAGPSLAGLLYTVNRALPFLVDAASYAASVVSLLFIRAEFQEERAATQGRLWAEMCAGLRWLWGHAQLRFLALLVGGLNLCSFGYPLILIVRARELHANAFAIGLLFGIGGIGGMLGSLLAAPLRRRFTLEQIIVGAVWGWVLTWLPFALAQNLPALFVADVVGWPVVSIFLVTQYSYRLTLIPEELLGRVNSVFRFIGVGSEPFSLAITGALLQALGGASTVLVITAPQIALAVITTLRRGLWRSPCAGTEGYRQDTLAGDQGYCAHP
jgi:MFS family permease